MTQSYLRLIKRFSEYIRIDEINKMPKGIRGIYVLYKFRSRLKKYDVVYVGMNKSGKGGIRKRLKTHRRLKKGLWTHCSIFQVWDNISDEEILELEGLFRHIYRSDSRANKLNKQGSFKKLKKIEDPNFSLWGEDSVL